MAKRRKQSAVQKEYARQRKRLQSAKSRLQKQGFIDISLPEVPKTITKASVRRLASIKPEDLRKKGRYISTEGEIISNYSRYKNKIKEDIKKKQQKAKMTFNSIERFIEIVEAELPDMRTFYVNRQPAYYDVSPRKQMIISLLNDRIAEVGETAVNNLLHENWETVQASFETVWHDSKQERVEQSFIALANLLKGSALTPQEATTTSDMADG